MAGRRACCSRSSTTPYVPPFGLIAGQGSGRVVRRVGACGSAFAVAGMWDGASMFAGSEAFGAVMCPGPLDRLRGSAAACNVDRGRASPWLLCMCHCFAGEMGSGGRDTPPGTRIPRYGAREVVKNE